MSRLSVTKLAHCPFSAAVELSEKVVAGRKGMYVTPSAPFGERVHFAAASTDDCTDEARKHEALLVAWRPQAYALFPDFHGVVTVRPEQRGGAELRLHGEYTPPYGAPGKVFDAILGRMLALATMRHFLDDLAADIDAAYANERKQTTTA
jgi:hypothetical protein